MSSALSSGIRLLVLHRPTFNVIGVNSGVMGGAPKGSWCCLLLLLVVVYQNTNNNNNNHNINTSTNNTNTNNNKQRNQALLA